MSHGLIISITVIASAFFSGMEIAFISSNRLRLEVDIKRESLTSHILSIFSNDSGRFIATMLIGNNIALVIYGLQMAQVLQPIIANYVQSGTAILLLQTIFSTVIILVTAEFIPKAIFRIKPNVMLNIFAYPVFFFYVIFYPISVFTVWLSNSFLSLIFKDNFTRTQNKELYTVNDLSTFINENVEDNRQNNDEEHDVTLFRNALDFSSVKLRDCMIPRTEIVAVEVNDTLTNLKKQFISTHLSKILIYEDNIDNIIGYVHNLELFKNMKSLKSRLLPISIVPETMPAQKLLNKLIEESRSIAVVVDEFGGTSGIVTIEDIIEEIFGEIEDEHDKNIFTEKQLSEKAFLFSGRLEIDHINKEFGLNIPKSDDYETLAGFIINTCEIIPQNGDLITIKNFKITITKATKIKIETVKLELID